MYVIYVIIYILDNILDFKTWMLWIYSYIYNYMDIYIYNFVKTYNNLDI